MELGADYFMIKPCEPETIYERIKLLSTSLAAKRTAANRNAGEYPHRRQTERPRN